MEHTQEHDLPPAYSPQNIADVLPIYRPEDNDSHVHTYLLQQTSPSTQGLFLGNDDSSSPLYHVRSFKTGGFMNRKPHISISRTPDEKVPLSEARFDIHGTGTSISYNDASCVQRLELEDSRLQILKINIHGKSLWWQPFPGNKDVIELTNDVDEILARFVCAPPPPSSSTSLKRKFAAYEVGRLHVVDALIDSDVERLGILCSAIVVVERAKRRAAILNNKASAYGAVRSLSGTSGNYFPQ